jgi:hypothetical protein
MPQATASDQHHTGTPRRRFARGHGLAEAGRGLPSTLWEQGVGGSKRCDLSQLCGWHQRRTERREIWRFECITRDTLDLWLRSASETYATTVAMS